jgi:S1-C subfamily serine protease
MISDELDSSDQKSFQEAGIPAVQFFSGPHLDYHKPTDTADKINAGGLAKVASVAKEVIEYLASRQEPLTATITTERNIEPEPQKERKVSFGIIPDFGYQGSGCRISGVIQDSAAERASLKEGDIITGINSVVVHRLKDLSDVLKSLHPGDKVFISFLREGNEMKIEAEVTERR